MLFAPVLGCGRKSKKESLFCVSDPYVRPYNNNKKIKVDNSGALSKYNEHRRREYNIRISSGTQLEEHRETHASIDNNNKGELQQRYNLFFSHSIEIHTHVALELGTTID